MNKLEENNYKVDSTLREVKEFIGYVIGYETKIKCKVNKEGDIREYVSGVPEELIGEQLFTWSAVKRLGLENRLPKFEDFKNIDKSDLLFPGYWYPYNKKFLNISSCTDCWLADGYYVRLNEDSMFHYDHSHEFGFSLRLLKELESSADSTIGKFDKLVERAEKYGAKMGAKAGYELGEILK